ncbi:hypothetical protein N7G274_003671 [Stereocaulon virgatum]|uniref:GDP-mannose transporter n=1 Tax=Stereocaulon virgatum TaxID=373712 RepID=A0ABR4AE17_9LECA
MDTLSNEAEKIRLMNVEKGHNLEVIRPRSQSGSSERTLLNMSDTEMEEKRRSADLEKEAAEGLLPKTITKDHIAPDPYARAKMLFWMAINTVATVLIVFCNKAIFSDKSFGQCQAAFAAFHFVVTGATLYILSRPMFAMFDPKRIGIPQMLPLAIAMAGNIVGMNLSLQVSTITFYQITRVLLTPCVAVINFFFYKKYIPRAAAYALIPMCFGVALISYYDQKPAPVAGQPIKAVGGLSVLLALGSVGISGIYTVWVGTYQRKYEVNGFQLLYNQAPLGAIVLLYAVPWTDKFGNLNQAPMNKWMMILLSGFLAAMINVSQFFIIGTAGAVESTVVGHLKTCLIVLIGAFTGGRIITDKAALGIMLALCSIFAYSYIMMKQSK